MGISRRLIFPGLLLAAVTIGGCGGGGTTTPATATPSPTPTSTNTPGSGAAYTLGGSSTQMTLTAGSTPALASLSAYQNISLTAQFAAVASGSGTVTLSDATGSGDITPNTLPADNATAGAIPLLYLSFFNPGATDISFGSNFPTVTMTDSAGFGGKTTCEFDVYSNNGTAFAWSSIASASVSGNSVTIGPATLPAGNTVDFKANNQQMAAIACK